MRISIRKSFAVLTALCLSLSLSALAGSASKTGETAPRGTKGTLNVKANLSVFNRTASASTRAVADELLSENDVKTILSYTYSNFSTGRYDTISNVGKKTISITPTNTSSYQGVVGESSHTVASAEWGNWSAELSATAS